MLSACCFVQVMMSVSMELVPENFEQEYVAVICPVAKRRIVVSYYVSNICVLFLYSSNSFLPQNKRVGSGTWGQVHVFCTLKLYSTVYYY